MNPKSKPVIVSWNRLHIADRYTYFMCKFPVFEIFEVRCLWPILMMVKRQRKSKDMVPIDSTHVVSYSTFVDPTVISVTVYEYLMSHFYDLELGGFMVIWVKVHSANQKLMTGFLSDILWVQHHTSLIIFKLFEVKLLWPQSRTVQGQPRSKIMAPTGSAWVVSCSTSTDPISYLSPFSKYLISNFNDLELRGFKVIQGQSSLWHQKPMFDFLSDVFWLQHHNLTVFDIYEVKLLWPTSRMVQG